MRNEPNLKVEKYRERHPYLGRSPSGSNHGYFIINKLRVISSGSAWEGAKGWEHVSVSRADGRMPSWLEMKKVKELFWRDDECVVQYHPPKSDYVNIADGCLHLWRHEDGFPMPPVEQV